MSNSRLQDPVQGQNENRATPPTRSVYVPTGAQRSVRNKAGPPKLSIQLNFVQFDRRYQNGKLMSVRDADGRLKYRGVIRDARQRADGTWEYLIHYEMSGTEEWVVETDLRLAK
jgi:hypothetical protein